MQRKGIDRLVTWLQAYADVLPRPAAILFASDDGPPDPELLEVVEKGLLEWDTSTTGRALVDRLRNCRAVILLSRWEAQARVMREAAVLGLPTISTSTGNFADVNALVGKGEIVDGDDPASIHRAFEAVLYADRSAARAREIFDPASVGDFLYELLRAAAAGVPWTHADYYRHLGARR